jgi:hypothetical protein
MCPSYEQKWVWTKIATNFCFSFYLGCIQIDNGELQYELIYVRIETWCDFVCGNYSLSDCDCNLMPTILPMCVELATILLNCGLKASELPYLLLPTAKQLL